MGREDGGHQDGVALLLKLKARQVLTAFSLLSPCTSKMRLRIISEQLQQYKYAPTSAVPKEEIDKFYEDLQKTLQGVSRDFKAKVGSDWNSRAGAIGRCR